MRDAELSNDFTVTVDVIADAAQKLKSQNETYDHICCIYPVTPLLTANRLKQALSALESGRWEYVFPAIEFPSPIERGFKKKEI